MLTEFIGLPGCGKTTAEKILIESLLYNEVPVLTDPERESGLFSGIQRLLSTKSYHRAHKLDFKSSKMSRLDRLRTDALYDTQRTLNSTNGSIYLPASGPINKSLDLLFASSQFQFRALARQLLEQLPQNSLLIYLKIPLRKALDRKRNKEEPGSSSAEEQLFDNFCNYERILNCFIETATSKEIEILRVDSAHDISVFKSQTQLIGSILRERLEQPELSGQSIAC